MTAVTDAVIVLEILAGKTLTNAQMANIAESFIGYRVEQGLTNEQIAQTFLNKTKRIIRQRVRSDAIIVYNATTVAAASAAGDAAEIDLI
jgi:hypothetical protein